MGKVQYMIRLYRAHDLDLVALLERREFSIQRAAYAALKAYCGGQAFVISQPPAKTVQGKIKRTYGRKLILDSEKDAEVIEVLEKITKGYRNNFIKNILRLYIREPLTESFLIDESQQESFHHSFEIFKEGVPVRQAGKADRRGRGKGHDSESMPEPGAQKVPVGRLTGGTAKTEGGSGNMAVSEPEESKEPKEVQHPDDSGDNTTVTKQDPKIQQEEIPAETIIEPPDSEPEIDTSGLTDEDALGIFESLL